MKSKFDIFRISIYIDFDLKSTIDTKILSTIYYFSLIKIYIYT